MDEVLERAMEPVLRDVRSSGLEPPGIGDEPWADDPSSVSAMLWSADGSGVGVSADRRVAEHERIARVADQVQEWVIEQRWGAGATNWPACPRHPDSHPLQASVRGGAAVWLCPADDVPVAPSAHSDRFALTRHG